jgi:hypothetical protein
LIRAGISGLAFAPTETVGVPKAKAGLVARRYDPVRADEAIVREILEMVVPVALVNVKERVVDRVSHHEIGLPNVPALGGEPQQGPDAR